MAGGCAAYSRPVKKRSTGLNNHLPTVRYICLQLLWRSKGFLAQFPAWRFPPSSVYIISHERSGTHFLINTLLLNACVRRGYGFGVGAGWGRHNIGEWFGPYDQPERRFSHIEAVNSRWNELPRRASVIKSHCDRRLFEAKYLPAPVVYIYRDPRDTLVSWYHYFNQDRFYRIHPFIEDHRCSSFSEFIRRPVSDFLKWNYSLEPAFSNVVERWAVHVKGWLTSRDDDVVLVRFRDMKSDPREVTRRIASHVGIRSRARFRHAGLMASESMLPRKGLSGDWRNTLSAEDEGFIRATIEQAGLNWEEVTER